MVKSKRDVKVMVSVLLTGGVPGYYVPPVYLLPCRYKWENGHMNIAHACSGSWMPPTQHNDA